MGKPLLSIVIANYNYGRYLSEAIESVINQGMGNQVELIVCDAASTDNSIEIIKKYEKHISWWCSEKDGGQSAAFNKGFAHANGRFLTWLNADDGLFSDVCRMLLFASERFPDCEWFVGGEFYLDPEMRIVKCSRARPFSKIRAKYGHVQVWGPSSFFTKNLLDSVGGVDERFHYAMDGDLWHKFHYKAGATYRPFIDYAWGLRLHPGAKMSGHNFENDSSRDPNHPKWEQLKKETEWMSLHYPIRHLNSIPRILSLPLWSSIMSAVDTLRYKGLPYRKAFR